MRILLVEDDPSIVAGLKELLGSDGYDVVCAQDQDKALELASSPDYVIDLVLLDVTLRQGSGFAVCSALKSRNPATPVIFLTASGDEVSTVAGLSMGADDYISKPFRPRELLARISAALRRSRKVSPTIELGSIVIDPESAVVSKRGEEIVLSALEYRLLLQFALNKGKLITRERMREVLWDDAGAYVEDNTLSVYIKRLRDRIEDDPSNPQIIVTVRGLGYKAVA